MTTKNNEYTPEYCPIELTIKEMWEDEIHNYKGEVGSSSLPRPTNFKEWYKNIKAISPREINL